MRISVSCNPPPAQQTALDHVAVIGERILAERQQHRAADDQRQGHRQEDAQHAEERIEPRIAVVHHAVRPFVMRKRPS
jgi:hypothetical protein